MGEQGGGFGGGRKHLEARVLLGELNGERLQLGAKKRCDLLVEERLRPAEVECARSRRA